MKKIFARIGPWRLCAGTLMLALIPAYGSDQFSSLALAFLTSATIACVLLAEDIERLERVAKRTKKLERDPRIDADEVVSTVANRSDWRRPENIAIIFAAILAASWLFQFSVVLAALVFIVVTGVTGARLATGMYTGTQTRSKPQWSEERWRTPSGTPVRQLHIDATLPTDAALPDHPLYGRTVRLAVRTQPPRPMVFLAFGQTCAWSKLRRSEPLDDGPTMRHDGFGPIVTSQWKRDDAPDTMHTQCPEALIAILIRGERLRIGLALGEGIIESVAFMLNDEDARARLERFIETNDA